MSVGRFQSSVKITYRDFLLDDFSVFILSWSARYRRFQTAAPSPSGPSESTPPAGDDGRGWEEELRCVEEVGISAIRDGSRSVLYFIYMVYLTRIFC